MKLFALMLHLTVLLPALAGAKQTPAKPLIEADCVHLVDGASGKVLFSQGGNQTRQVASTQKLVMALVIVEAGDLDKRVTVTAQDASCQPTKLPNSVGGTYTRRELLQAMLVLSANDAARALARDHSGSEAAFGAKMTAMARRLGATSSVFKDSAGFTAAGQYSTAAGHCAAIVWEENGRRLFAVVLRGHREMFWLQLPVVLKLHAHGLL